MEGTVELAWNGNPESDDVAGYKVHIGLVSGSYFRSIDVGKVNECKVSDLKEGVPHFFAATAYNHHGQRSSFSKELKHTCQVQKALTMQNQAPRNSHHRRTCQTCQCCMNKQFRPFCFEKNSKVRLTDGPCKDYER
jgi:hypothetical protein